MKKFNFILLACLLVGCQSEGKVSIADKSKQIFCVDSRDGEKFSFQSSTIKNVRIGSFGADTCFVVTDEANIERIMCKSYETFLNCKS